MENCPLILFDRTVNQYASDWAYYLSIRTNRKSDLQLDVDNRRYMQIDSTIRNTSWINNAVRLSKESILPSLTTNCSAGHFGLLTMYPVLNELFIRPLDLLYGNLTARSVCDAGHAWFETVRTITLWCLTFLTSTVCTISLILNLKLASDSLYSYLAWNCPYDQL